MFPNYCNTTTMTTSADTSICRFVKLTGAFTVAQCSAASDIAIGITTQDEWYPPSTPGAVAGLASPSGNPVRIVTLGQIAMLELGTGGATFNQLLVPDANGKGVVITATAGKTACALALETGVAGDRIRVMVLMPMVVTS